MSKALPSGELTITFSHSLPIHHVLAYLRTAATLRRVARDDLEMASKYADGAKMRVYLEGIARNGFGRANAIEYLVKVTARHPQAKPFVIDYVARVLHPSRSEEDLSAFAREVERGGMERVEEMGKWGFQREQVEGRVTRNKAREPTTVVFIDPENPGQALGLRMVDYITEMRKPTLSIDTMAKISRRIVGSLAQDEHSEVGALGMDDVSTTREESDESTHEHNKTRFGTFSPTERKKAVYEQIFWIERDSCRVRFYRITELRGKLTKATDREDEQDLLSLFRLGLVDRVRVADKHEYRVTDDVLEAIRSNIASEATTTLSRMMMKTFHPDGK